MGNEISTKRRFAIGITTFLAVLTIVGFAWFRWPTPQIPLTDEQVFNTVEALFTAVTSRDRNRLEECDRRLREFRAEGKLSASATSHLKGIIQQARDGDWEPASRRLYDFMWNQRGTIAKRS